METAGVRLPDANRTVAGWTDAASAERHHKELAIPTRPWIPVAGAVLLVVGAMWAPISAQVALPIGATTTTRVPSGGSTELVYHAKGPGFLAVVVRSAGDEDVRIAVTDADYQVLPEGQGDDDLNGDVGAEQLLVTIPYAGTYHVLAETFGGGARGSTCTRTVRSGNL
jgi:hypothetical protein